MKKLFISMLCIFLLGGCTLQKTHEPVDEIIEQNEIEEPIKEVIPISRAEEILQNMSLEQKIGQMFIVRYSDEAAQDISKYYYGGFIFFAKDFQNETMESMNKKLNSLQVQSPYNMFMGVDEEGGSVNRISLFPQYRTAPFPSPQSLYHEGGFDLVKSDALEKCELLKKIGLNMNFAPVVDVPEKKQDFMYNRSFGIDVSLTSEYAKEVVSVMKENNMISVLKHFPGYGNNEDTHTGVATDKRSLNTFYERDFIPFSAGIEAGADMVLVSHTIVKSIDKFTPSSLSFPIHEILRNDLNFTGVIVTDDLIMEGVKELYSDEEAAILAILAGNDLLCSSQYSVQIPAVIKAVQEGRISEERINESVLRIINCKIKRGILA